METCRVVVNERRHELSTCKLGIQRVHVQRRRGMCLQMLKTDLRLETDSAPTWSSLARIEQLALNGNKVEAADGPDPAKSFREIGRT